MDIKQGYDKWYVILLLIPVALLILSLVYLGFFYKQNGDFLLKDVSLSGGTSITLKGSIDQQKLESSLKQSFPDIGFRKLTDIRTGESLALVVETSATPEEIKPLIESTLGYALTEDNSSIEFSGPALSQSFYSELLKIVLLSFILMAFVVFMIFGESLTFKLISFSLSLSAIRLTFPSKILIIYSAIIFGIFALIFAFYKTKNKKEKIYIFLAFLIFILIAFFPYYKMIFFLAIILFFIYLFTSTPSVAVIFAAFSDIIMTLAIIDLMGVKISSAGLAAFLMLIGYSVDTDILLTARALKKEGTLNQRILGAFKTGIFMTLTALAAVLPAFFLISGLPDSFRQIFLILAIGLSADILNTWLTNAGIIKWYCQRRGLQ